MAGHHGVEWEIEVERNGRWVATLYGGSSGTVDEAFVTAKRYMEALESMTGGRDGKAG
jgi:hypothetical protein